MPEVTPKGVAAILRGLCPVITEKINAFSQEFLVTRGGRIGSGMGALLEALWGYHANNRLSSMDDTHPYEIAWMVDHDYNDFACVHRDQPWNPETREGEILRIEVKSMNSGADEAKAHFDELVENLKEEDLLLVLVWGWSTKDDVRFSPKIDDFFIGPANSVANLRDKLHLARGGSFVKRSGCPDGCSSETCTHHGEPLNAKGSRERSTGPNASKPPNSSFAANFGGLVRMIKTDSAKATKVFREIRQSDEIAHDYISFIHRNFPKEEKNRYSAKEWREIASALELSVDALNLDQIIEAIRVKDPKYRDLLRGLEPQIEQTLDPQTAEN
jgi:hypothetical protein